MRIISRSSTTPPNPPPAAAGQTGGLHASCVVEKALPGHISKTAMPVRAKALLTARAECYGPDGKLKWASDCEPIELT